MAQRQQYIIHQFTDADGKRIDALQAGQEELQRVFDECAKRGYTWTIMEGPTLIFERTVETEE